MQSRPVFIYCFHGKFYTLVSFYYIFIRNGRYDRHNRLYDNDEHDKQHDKYSTDKCRYANDLCKNLYHNFHRKTHRFNHYGVYHDFRHRP